MAAFDRGQFTQGFRRVSGRSGGLPFLAYVLGVAGLLPFIGMAGMSLLVGAFKPVPHLAAGMLAYAGAILSFLGAVHWGLALEQKTIVVPEAARIDQRRLLLGVCPALVAWIAVYLGMTRDVKFGIVLEILGFVGVYLVERAGSRMGALPGGYLRLRFALTVIACLCLAATLLAPASLT